MKMSVSDLQKQCQELLCTLKMNQTSLRQDLLPVCQTSSLENNLQGKEAERKPEYARQKLKSIMRQKNGESLSSAYGNSCLQSVAPQGPSAVGYSELTQTGTLCSRERSLSRERLLSQEKSQDEDGKYQDRPQGHERSRLVQGESSLNERTDGMVGLSTDHDAMHDYFQSRVTDSLMEDGTNSVSGVISTDDNTHPAPVAKATTPIMVRRRRIIDRNVHVDSKLSDAELKEFEKGTSGLNFSYSQNPDETLLKAPEKEAVADPGVADKDLSYTYAKHLADSGNNRQLNNFIKEATIKPKTILNSTQAYTSSSRTGPGVSFQSTASTSGNSSLFRGQAKERRMLGYDWIAALIDNQQGLMDESESYFHELREFRRCNRDECCNDFYMEGPFTLAETEPPAVDKALNETKVLPYTVNERLFTTPVTENLLGEPMVPGGSDAKKEEPTADNPRFVRVSIPRSTLLVPHKARPHRRKSFDGSDSCSLIDHCLLGWNAVSPATLPTASSVSLTDAVVGTNPKHTTTMAEAERVASTFQWPLLTDPRPMTESMQTWRKQYMDTTLNFPNPDSSLSLSSSLGAGTRQLAGSTRQRTDALLNATYSMMYEMQQAKAKRGEELTRNVGEAAA